jgi:hypothetical protein
MVGDGVFKVESPQVALKNRRDRAAFQSSIRDLRLRRVGLPRGLD